MQRKLLSALLAGAALAPFQASAHQIAAADDIIVVGRADRPNNDKAFVFHPYQQRTFVVELGYKLRGRAR